MFVVERAALVVFSWMHQIPSAYVVAQMFWYVNEAAHQSCILTMYASMLMLVCGIAGKSVLAVIFYEIDLTCCYYSNLRHS